MLLRDSGRILSTDSLNFINQDNPLRDEGGA